jgi:aryl-alcohol dehydrogenase-like predicted oxidoreductase
MMVSLEASLKKLGTTYLDILCKSPPLCRYPFKLTTDADVHWWDWTTDIPEIMQGLNNLVRAGKGWLIFYAF